MDSKTTGIVSYLTIIGWVIALAAGEKNEYTNFHINQSLVLLIASIIASAISRLYFIPLNGMISSLAGVAVFVLWIIAFIGACQGEEKEMPVLGSIKIM